MAQSLRIWDQIIATGFLLQAGWLLVTWGGQAIIVCPSSLCGNWKAEVGSPGFLEALKVNFGRELNGSPGEEVAWGRTFKTNRGGKWQGETWLWKVTWSWNSEWKFATFHGSFLWSRIFPSIGAPSNWYIYIIIIIQIYIYIYILTLPETSTNQTLTIQSAAQLWRSLLKNLPIFFEARPTVPAQQPITTTWGFWSLCFAPRKTETQLREFRDFGSRKLLIVSYDQLLGRLQGDIWLKWIKQQDGIKWSQTPSWRHDFMTSWCIQS